MDKCLFLQLILKILDTNYILLESVKTKIVLQLQSTPLNRVTSVRGHFVPIKRRTLLTENILYQLLCMRAIPVLPKVARLSG